jgi:tRNAThr (cytosine32-N3)-methyltransferase
VSTEVDDENGDGENEGECEAKDERLPDWLASPASLDSSSSTAHSGPVPSPPDPYVHGIHPSLRGSDVVGLAHALFTITQLGVDRRLLVNRKRQLKMYRVWMQGKFQRTEADVLTPVVEPDAGIP